MYPRPPGPPLRLPFVNQYGQTVYRPGYQNAQYPSPIPMGAFSSNGAWAYMRPPNPVRAGSPYAPLTAVRPSHIPNLAPRPLMPIQPQRIPQPMPSGLPSPSTGPPVHAQSQRAPQNQATNKHNPPDSDPSSAINTYRKYYTDVLAYFKTMLDKTEDSTPPSTDSRAQNFSTPNNNQVISLNVQLTVIKITMSTWFSVIIVLQFHFKTAITIRFIEWCPNRE